MVMLLAGCPSLLRKGNEIAGREKIGEELGGVWWCLPEAGNRAYIKTSLTPDPIGRG